MSPEQIKSLLDAAIVKYQIDEKNVYYSFNPENKELSVSRHGMRSWRMIVFTMTDIQLFNGSNILGVTSGREIIDVQLTRENANVLSGEWNDIETIIDQWARAPILPSTISMDFPTNVSFAQSDTSSYDG